MKRIQWADRQPGDIGFSAVPGVIHDAIWTFEQMRHSHLPADFEATHAFICGYNDKVIEAWFDLSRRGAATIAEESEYEGRPVELYRIDRDELQIPNAIDQFLRDYGADGYSFLTLVRFAVEGIERAVHDLLFRGLSPPVNALIPAYVCSQAVLIFAQYPSNDVWLAEMDVKDCDPLSFRVACLDHSNSDE